MVWVAEDEPRPGVLKTGFRSRKRMFTNFFNTQGPVVIDMMPDKATTSAAYYTTTSVLPEVLLHIQSTAQTRRRSRIQLHHDNTVPHKARVTQTYLDDNGIHLIEHRPYSPDLASCDFWPFSKSQISPCWEVFFKDPRPCSSCACRDEGHTCFRVPRMLSEVKDEDAAIYRSRGKLL